MKYRLPRSPAVFAVLSTVLALAVFGGPASARVAAKAATDSAKVAPDVRNSPGYVPLHDPDSLDEALGRRANAPLVEMEFHAGARSLRELGAEVCHALHTGVPNAMLDLCVKSDEFRVILWPEFPQSRPATGLRWDDAWMILYGRLNGGSVSAVRDYEDHRWKFLRIKYLKVVSYRNFKLYNNIVITAKSDAGKLEQFTFIRSVAERAGRFQIYSMRD